MNLRRGREDLICDAEYRAPDRIFVQFDDNLTAEIALVDLELPVDQFRWNSIAATATGEAITIEDITGELIPIEAASVRAIVDPAYAAEMTANFARLRGPIDTLPVAESAFQPPREWYDEN